ncbi:MAG TPA: efflux RND transporter periplasmic adaptor subunit [Myxococcota bacterium]|nr:efflux RND transporter periplasmic adaptor subunit [Myxococcota bacterium]
MSAVRTRRERSSCVAGAILALVAALAGCGGAPEESGSAEPVALVEATVATRGAIEQAIVAYGTVAFDPDGMRTVPFVRSGAVSRVAVVAGQPVRAGDLLAELGPVPGASLDLQRARIDVRFAERELARVKRLRSAHLATNADLSAAEKSLAESRAALHALGAGDAPEAGSLFAPADGVVVSVDAVAGSLAQPGQAAFTIASGGALVVPIGLEPEQAAQLRDGAPVRIEPLSAEASGRAASAVLARLQRTVAPTTQLVDALVRVEDPPAWLIAGAQVRVSLTAGRAADVVLVSREALTERAGERGAFAIEEGRARWRPLAIGLEGGDVVEVRSGLAAGEKVVTSGRTSVQDGMRVRTSADAAGR